MQSAPTILFVGHDAYRAGAQIALLRLMRWLRQNGSIDPVLLMKEGGDLVDQYQEIAPTHVVYPDGQSRATSPSYGARLSRYVFGRRSSLATVLDELRHLHVQLIYINSVASLDILDTLLTVWDSPVVCHVHELDMGIRGTIGADAFRKAVGQVDTFISVSQAVRDNLCQLYEVPSAKVCTIYGMAPGREDLAGARERAQGAQTRRQIGVPSDAFVVGGCGTMDWRKGPDVFIQIARQLTATRPERAAHFVWVGGHSAGHAVDALRYDVERCGLADRVHFVGPQSEIGPYFATFDCFLLSSREDPFPLVCLEVASLGVPIVCFERAGGMPEFVGTDAGFVVPYLDVVAAAASLNALAESPELRRRLGQQARERTADHHVDVIGARIQALLESRLRSRAPS